MNILETLDRWQFNFRYRLARMLDQRARAKAYKKRCLDNDWFVMAFLAVGLATATPACAHGPSTAETLHDHQALRAECSANWRRIEAMDAPAEERLRLYEAEGVRCREAGLAMCEVTDTCGEFHR